MTASLILHDVRNPLPLEDASVQTCVTSPPYWKLRDYGTGDAQLGMERTPEEFIENLVAVFREVRRVLRHDGTLWLNIGDSYAAQRGGTHMPAQTVAGGVSGKGDDAAFRGMGGADRRAAHRDARAFGMKHKDLIGVPWMLAFALRADGWYLRSDIIWHKPNPMPESVRDRPTKAHEYLFLLTKSARYFYDADAIREPAKSSTPMKMPDGWDTGAGAHGSYHRNGREKGERRSDKQRGHGRRHDGFNDRWDAMSEEQQQALGANKRSVWTVATQGFAGAHFATFPVALVEPCILAGSRAGDVVLDPFCGSGTTGLVALRHGRQFIGLDNNPAYLQMASNRISGEAPLLNTVELAGAA